MNADAPEERPPVVVVTGPTASGKTPMAIEIAQRFDGEIVNADSMQVYRFMDIGTAKPDAAQRSAVPHHLIDVVDPDTRYNAARYLGDARRAAAAIHQRGHPVLLVGGTGLYIRVFLEGVLGGAPPDPELRAALETEHAEAVAAGEPERLHRRLAAADPAAAARIHANDLRRIIRALEISGQGVLASERRRQHRFADRPYRVLHLALDPGREALNQRIDRRCQEMIEAGLLYEVRGLCERGYGPELPPMQAIGYRHMLPVVAGSDTLANVLPAMQRDTRQFARRQRTWLRAVEGLITHPPDDLAGVLREVEAFLGKAGQ
jgi:tRNA dimethylallyltransferase